MIGGRALFGRGPLRVTEFRQTPNANFGSQNMGDKVRVRTARPPAKVPKYVKWKRMWRCPDNWDVGLEAAII